MNINRYKQSKGGLWSADNFDGTYTNPILYVDYSDPDVCRVGDDYFMVASSFCNAPGLPLLHSKDLVNWKLINYCIDKVPGVQFDKPRHGCGVWAPAIRYFNGEYIVFFPMPDEGIYVVKTKDPWGKWDEPYCLFSGKGWIDPCPFFDEDGRVYMVNAFAKSRIGFKSILQVVELNTDCTKFIGEPKYVFDGNKENQETIEGPKLYKRNGYYYIFAPAGGVKQGWQTVLRSKSIWGPYEYQNVMYQEDTPVNGPHQGGWVDTPDGEDWFIHFQDVYAAGRIIHLQPMTWEKDWPVIGQKVEGKNYGKPVLTYKKPNTAAPEFSKNDISVNFNFGDNFEDDKLNINWQWNANDKEDFYKLDTVNKRLELKAVSYAENTSITNMPNLLLQKWALPEFSSVAVLCTDKMKTGDSAGYVSLGVTYGAIGVEKTEDGFKLVKINGTQKFDKEVASATDEKTIIRSLNKNTEKLYFKMKVKQLEPVKTNTDGPYEFPIPREVISFEVSMDNDNFEKVLEYEAVAGRWVGVKHGLFSFHNGETPSGYAVFENFYIQK